MRLLVLLSCALLLGWVVAWMYYASYTSAADPDSPTLPYPPSAAADGDPPGRGRPGGAPLAPE